MRKADAAEHCWVQVSRVGCEPAGGSRQEGNKHASVVMKRAAALATSQALLEQLPGPGFSQA